jgi:hypothetical protein
MIVVAVCLGYGIASAKMPFFGLEVDPLGPAVGEPITLTMTCYPDQAHTRPLSSCFGAPPWDRMAWVHPLDDEGRLDRSDWIAVEGRAIPSGATHGTVTLNEPGSYDVLPLWRTWGPDHSDGFPDAIRIEVGEPRRIVPIAVAGVVGTLLAVAAWRRRTASAPVTP